MKNAIKPNLDYDTVDKSNRKLIAITFDDGPALKTTPMVLDLLEKYKVKASFFLIGQFITEETKAIVERELSLGCEIENHSWSHPYMNEMTSEEIREEVHKTTEIMKQWFGITPVFFRPPYIAISNGMYENIDLPFICGINCLDWDVTVSAEQRSEMILNNAKDGDIVLLHDLEGNMNTVKALETIIPGLLEQGFEFVTVSRLFELKGVDPHVKYKIWSNTNGQ